MNSTSSCLTFQALSFLEFDSSSGHTHAPESKRGISRLLIVDDEPALRRVLKRHFARLGYECLEAETGAQAIEILRVKPVDAVLSDLNMPQMDGLELLRTIKKMDPDLAVLLITGNNEIEKAISAIQSEADDYLLKPFNLPQITSRVAQALQRTELKRKLREYQNGLESMVVQRTSQVHRLTLSVIQSLITALEARDPYTDGHSRRVAWLGLQLGRAAGLSVRDQEILQIAGMFHDLGKIGIREAVLAKAGPLSEQEYSHIKGHPDIGVRVLEPLSEFRDALPAIRHHHEHYNGNGYPCSLSGDRIPAGARILAIVDAFDAMTSDRPYRTGMTAAEALAHLNHGAGTQFDPYLVRIFLSMAERGTLHRIPLNPRVEAV
jgi:putative two-component system response regulator